MLHFPAQILAITDLNLFSLGLQPGAPAQAHPFLSNWFQLVAISSPLLSSNVRISRHSFRAIQLPFGRSKSSPNPRLSRVSTFYRFLILLSPAARVTGLLLVRAPLVSHLK